MSVPTAVADSPKAPHDDGDGNDARADVGDKKQHTLSKKIQARIQVPGLHIVAPSFPNSLASSGIRVHNRTLFVRHASSGPVGIIRMQLVQVIRAWTRFGGLVKPILGTG